MQQPLATEILRDMKHRVRNLVIAVIAMVCIEFATIIGFVWYINETISKANSDTNYSLYNSEDLIKSMQVTAIVDDKSLRIRKEDETWLKNLDLQ